MSRARERGGGREEEGERGREDLKECPSSAQSPAQGLIPTLGS